TARANRHAGRAGGTPRGARVPAAASVADVEGATMRTTACALITAVAATTLVRAETHRYLPVTFYNTYSFAHPPALRIKPGDRVVTKTIDAGGVDWNGKTVGSGPNPQTGPFYVEGAQPGDMLVVTIEKLETNPAA